MMAASSVVSSSWAKACWRRRMTGSPRSSSSSVIFFLWGGGLIKCLVKRLAGLKQQAANRTGGLSQDASGLGGREFTKGDEDNHLSLALGKGADGGDQVGITPGFRGRWRQLRWVGRPAAFPLPPRGPIAVPGDPEHPSLGVRMDRDRVPMCEGAGEGLRGRVLGRGPVERAGEQRPEHGVAVVLEEQRERLRGAHGHAVPSPLDRLLLDAAGEMAALCWVRRAVCSRLGARGGWIRGRAGIEEVGPCMAVGWWRMALAGEIAQRPVWRGSRRLGGPDPRETGKHSAITAVHLRGSKASML